MEWSVKTNTQEHARTHPRSPARDGGAPAGGGVQRGGGRGARAPEAAREFAVLVCLHLPRKPRLAVLSYYVCMRVFLYDLVYLTAL